MAERLCGLIPVYNNHMTIERVALGLRRYIEQIIIVDDGSSDGTESIVEALASTNPQQIHLQRLATNRGKGAAVQTGMKLAYEKGYTHALQIDADGQHNLEDVPRFIEAMRANPKGMIIGDPLFDESIPAIRKHGRKLTRLVVGLEAGTFRLPDAMCGFRIYPVPAIHTLGCMGSRMSYDPEVMIRALWAGIPFTPVPTRVRYLTPEEGGISHFRMFRDNLLNVWTHTRLLLQAPLRWVLRHARTKDSWLL